MRLEVVAEYISVSATTSPSVTVLLGDCPASTG